MRPTSPRITASRSSAKGGRAQYRSAKGAYTNPAEQRLGHLRSQLNYGAIEEILGGEGGLHGFVDGFQEPLNLASDAIHDTFFAVRSREKDS
jgi:hypothetical protein